MPKKSKKKAKPDDVSTVEAAGGGSPAAGDNNAKEEVGSKSEAGTRKGGGGQRTDGGGDDKDQRPPPPLADGDGYESPDIAEGLDELEELAAMEIGEDPDTPTDALEDLAALEIPDDNDDDGAGVAVADAKSKQERKAAAKLAKQEAKQEAEREKQREKQEVKAAAKLAKQEAKDALVKAAEEEAAAQAAAIDAAAIAALREEHGIKEGHPVEYHSATENAWVPAKLVEIRADGSLYVDLGNGRVNERCDPHRVRPALFRAKPKVLEAHLKEVKRRKKLESHATAAVTTAEAERLLAAKSLLLRSCHNGDLRGVREALRGGAHVNCRDTNLWTPLMCAARHGDAVCVQALITAAANVDSSSRGGATALHMAASNGRVDVILLLLKAGANLSAATDSGMRPRQLAERRGMLEAVATIDVFQEGGGLAKMQASTSSLAQREALRDVVTEAKVRRRQVVAYGQSIKKQKGQELLKSFRNQIGPLHRQAKVQQDYLATRGEAHAQEVEARWFSEHTRDSNGLLAGKRYLDLLTVHRFPPDKLDAASKNVALFRKLFDALDTRQQGWLPRCVVYEFLQTIDPDWSPSEGRQNPDYSEDQEGNWITTFQTMLNLYIGSSTSVTAVEKALLTDYSEMARLVADIAAIVRIGGANHGRSLIDYGEWTSTLIPTIARHTKKSHVMKPKELLEVWRFLSKVPEDDPRIKKYKHGGTDVSGVDHAQPLEPGHIDTATILASVRPDGNRSAKNQKLYKKFFNGVLLPSALALQESVDNLVAEQDTVTEGDWLRANRRVVVRASAQPNSTEVAILSPGESIQVLSIVRVSGSTMLRVQCVRGWVSHTSAIDNSCVFERLNSEEGGSTPSFDLKEIPTTDEEDNADQPSAQDQTILQDGNNMNERSISAGGHIELLPGMLCVALESLRPRKNAGPKARHAAGGTIPKGQAFHILSVSKKFPGYVLCYCGWVRILLNGKRPFVRFLDDTCEASQDFVIGGAGRISDVGPLGVTFIEAPNPHWIPGSNEPKFCATLHSVGRGSPAAKACKEMARGGCYGWVLESVEGVSVTTMTFDDVLSLIQRTTKRPMSLRLRPPCYISVPLKPVLNEDGTDIAQNEDVTEGQDEQGLGGCFFNSLMHGFYRTVHETTLRSGYQVSTRIAGVLAPGTFVEVIESRVNSMGHTRLLCVSLGQDDSDEGKGTQGWASLYGYDGRRLLRAQTEQELRDRDHSEHNTFLIEERSNEREKTKASNYLQARKVAGQNPLEIRMCNAAASGDAGWVLEQIQQGADPDCLDSSGCTAIMRAAGNGHSEVVKALCQHGIDNQKHILLNEVSEGGTALMMATANGHAKVAAMLLKNRADPLVADENGMRPIDIARRMKNDQLLTMLQEATNSAQREIARVHTRKSVQVAAMHMLTPQLIRQVAEACADVHEAVSAGNVPRTINAIGVLHSLDSMNAINRPDKKGTTPLAKAAAAGYCAIVSLLLAHKAMVDARSEGDQTALSIACTFGQIGATGLLLRAGADPNLALDSLSKFDQSVRLANPLVSSLHSGQLNIQKDKEKVGLAGCQLLLRKALLARNVVATKMKVGKRPTGVSPINIDVWTGGRIPGAGTQIKVNGVPAPVVLQTDVAVVPNGQLPVVGHDTTTDAQELPTAPSVAKKRGLRRRAVPMSKQPDQPNAEAPDETGLTEQTENPLATSYANSSLASPIADGQATFDVEEASPKAKGSEKKWSARLRRAAKTDNQQPAGLLAPENESSLRHDGAGLVDDSAAREDTEALAAIEIPNDDENDFRDESATEQIGDLL